jgi:hypothetical protein
MLPTEIIPSRAYFNKHNVLLSPIPEDQSNNPSATSSLTHADARLTLLAPYTVHSLGTETDAEATRLFDVQMVIDIGALKQVFDELAEKQ